MLIIQFIQRNGGETMPTKQTIAAPPKPKLIGRFSIGGYLCEVYRVHGFSERDQRISNTTMLELGESIDASMSSQNGEFMARHSQEIPPEYSECIFAFPMWTSPKKANESGGHVRGLDMKGVSWWCVMLYQDNCDWGNNCVLVRFTAAPKH